jgi:hypothetical protein
MRTRRADGANTINVDNKARDEATIWIRQNAPVPLTVLAIAQDPIANG